MRVRHSMRCCYMWSLQSALQCRAPDLLYIKRRVDRITNARTFLVCMATTFLNNSFQTKLSSKAFCTKGQSQKPSFLYLHFVSDNQVLTCASLARRYALWTLACFSAVQVFWNSHLGLIAATRGICLHEQCTCGRKDRIRKGRAEGYVVFANSHFLESAVCRSDQALSCICWFVCYCLLVGFSLLTVAVDGSLRVDWSVASSLSDRALLGSTRTSLARRLILTAPLGALDFSEVPITVYIQTFIHIIFKRIILVKPFWYTHPHWHTIAVL